jgi:hypothetical protein
MVSESGRWRWAIDVEVDLFVTRDITSPGSLTYEEPQPCRGSLPPIEGLENCTSMGVRSAGSRPKTVLNFYQSHNRWPNQNGAPIAEADMEFNLNRCLSHNAIARSQFVHNKTAEAVKNALISLRDASR